MYTSCVKSDLVLMVGRDENILWHGKPNKKCFILEVIFNPLLPFALIWLLFDCILATTFFSVVKLPSYQSALFPLLFFYASFIYCLEIFVWRFVCISKV